MSEIALQYIGKKDPFKFVNPKFKKPIIFSRTEPTWLTDHIANWFMELNPCSFVKVGEKGVESPLELEDAADIIKNKEKLDAEEAELNVEFVPEEFEDPPEYLVCPKCDKQYKNVPAGRRFYKDHIESCEG